MPAKPVVGDSYATWGTDLNAYLDVAHNLDGTLKLSGSAGTAGSVIFVGASGALAQDHANLFWDSTNHQLGIGTTTPAQRLHVVGSAAVTGSLGVGVTGPSGTIELNSTSYDQVIFDWTGSRFIRMYDTGSGGSFIIDNAPGTGNTLGTGVYLTHGSTSWGALSDERLKRNIRPLPAQRGLAAILKLHPVAFQFDTVGSTDDVQLGFTAQDVQRVIPEAVHNTGQINHRANGITGFPDGVLGMTYQHLMAPMVLALQELAARVTALEAKP